MNAKITKYNCERISVRPVVVWWIFVIRYCFIPIFLIGFFRIEPFEGYYTVLILPAIAVVFLLMFTFWKLTYRHTCFKCNDKALTSVTDFIFFKEKKYYIDI